MYEVKATGEKFASFAGAVATARAIGSKVFEVSTGLCRWEPAPNISNKRMRYYRERCAAYAAQEVAGEYDQPK